MSDPKRLTPRESEVIALVGDGKINKEIADTLGMSLNTVKFHLSNAMQKLDARTRAQAVAIWLRGVSPG